MRVVLDMDEVICKFDDRVLEWWNEDNGTCLTLDDVKTWDIASLFGPNGKYFLRSCMRYPEFYRDLDAVSGAVVGTKKLIDAGHDVVIATAVPKSAPIAYSGKLEWLRRNMPFFSIDNVVAVHRKDLLVDRLNPGVLFDDGLHNVLPWLGRGGTAVLFDRPWNRERAECEVYRESFKVVRHWNEFLDFVKTLDDAEFHAYAEEVAWLYDSSLETCEKNDGAEEKPVPKSFC